ncbi:chemotaxis protein CheW [Paraconexibacter antarcticus]|uniref:Chemotaxis protein CheW n=1 Tax=Paraconexibacter antarcticus TaxID=2949664 RepID=A0ABY5DRL4_9ACTN|nr:chemotaxis protein CheW [Paraconexibacter antarcticus]UTI64671.1 chemotaxis protein CheW [Paraconexibacter antarcticus]
MSDHTSGQLVVFSLGNEEYALPISYVHEIIRWTEPRAVASEDPCVCGVISLRGKILPVFDLATRLGLTSARSDRAKIVIVERDGSMAGVVVDDVEEVLTVTDDQLDRDGGSGVSGDCIAAIAKIEDRLVVLLSPEHIVVSGAEVTRADAAAAVAAAESDAADRVPAAAAA